MTAQACKAEQLLHTLLGWVALEGWNLTFPCVHQACNYGVDFKQINPNHDQLATFLLFLWQEAAFTADDECLSCSLSWFSDWIGNVVWLLMKHDVEYEILFWKQSVWCKQCSTVNHWQDMWLWYMCVATAPLYFIKRSALLTWKQTIIQLDYDLLSLLNDQNTQRITLF